MSTACLPRVVVVAVLVAGASASCRGSGKASSAKPSASPRQRFYAGSKGEEKGIVLDDRNVACGYDNVITATERIHANGKFCVADIVISNGSPEPFKLDPTCQQMITSKRSYPAHVAASLAATQDQAPFVQGIAPGANAVATLAFDAPVGTMPIALELHAACPSEGVRLPLTESR